MLTICLIYGLIYNTFIKYKNKNNEYFVTNKRIAIYNSKSGFRIENICDIEHIGIVREKNNYGEEVKALQEVMKKLGYYNGELTSFFDEELETALKQYQLDNEIEQTGKLDDLTIRYILAKYQDDKVADYYNEILEVLANN